MLDSFLLSCGRSFDGGDHRTDGVADFNLADDADRSGGRTFDFGLGLIRRYRVDRLTHLDDIAVTFTVTFPEGEAGDRAREMLPKSIQMSHDRLCTVSRTVLLGTPIAMRAAD